MEIKGDEFIKKVQLQQEREELEQKLSDLEEVESSIGENNTIHNEKVEEPIDTELGNIMLDNPPLNDENNKKKYLILGLILVILFLFTIIIIRLLTDSSKEDTFTSNKTNPIESKILNEDSNIEENFQKIMNERIKKDSDVKKVDSSEEKIKKIEDATKEEVEVKAIVNDDLMNETIKKIEQKKAEVKKTEIKKVVKSKPKPIVKKAPKKSIKDLVRKTSSSSPKGYFVQIGAFSKKPSSSYIAKIRNAKLKYKVYQVTVKGKQYNKVLIGPYASRATANNNIDNIKQKLNVSSAYILKF